MEEKLEISWRKPTKKYYGINYETFCLGHLNGIEVAQNRFIRGDEKKGNNDIAYKIAGVSGWIDYETFKRLLLAEDKRREPKRNHLRKKGLPTLADKYK